MRIEDVKITQESVDEFFDEIDVDALVDSLRMSYSEQSVTVSEGRLVYSVKPQNTYRVNSTSNLFYNMREVA